MKTAVNSPRTPYRNEAVFRSAQLLVASASAKPTHKRTQNSIIFAGGIICGLALALALFPTGRQLATRAASSVAVSVQSLLRPSTRFAATNAATEIFPAPAPRNQRSSGEPSSAELVIASSRDATTSIARHPTTGGATEPTGVVARSVDQLAASRLRIVITQSTTRLIFKGELSPGLQDALPVGVNFDLQFQPAGSGGKLQGVVTVLNTPAQSVSVSVVGNLIFRTITLEERRVNQDVPHQAYSGYVFVIELPEPSTTDEMTGFWRNNSVTGVMALKNALAL